MTKTITCAGAVAAALLVFSTGAAAAQTSEATGSDSLPGASETEGGYLGEAGELLPGSVTGSLPGYASGPLGSTATLVCNLGSAAGAAANLMGVPALTLPTGLPMTGITLLGRPMGEEKLLRLAAAAERALG